MGKLLIALGTWLLSDSIYSLSLYLSAPGYNGQRQTWMRDHYIRVIRAACAVTIIAIGVTYD